MTIVRQARPVPQAFCWCRPRAAERNRQWRSDNLEYIAAVNAARREGPFPIACTDCDEEFPAARRFQTRCRDCQRRQRNSRPRSRRAGSEGSA